MATDKLINHSQGESIITNLGSIATNLQNVTAISPAKFGMGYAVCDTAAGTAAKTANIANYVLTEGALVTVKFTNANTASNATLNLNNTGAKPLLYKGSALTTDIISAGDICTFIYSTANSGSYNIINVDALSGAGAGTVKSVGAEGGIITDQTAGAAISTTGSVKLNLKSETPFEGAASTPQEIEGKIYPVALDKDGHPAVSVPGTTYTEGTGIDIDSSNVISNTGVTAVAPSDSSTGTNGTISVTTNGTTAEVAVKGLNNAAYKDVATSISASGAVDTKVATEKAVADSISGKAIGANSSTTNAIATFAGTDGKTLADSAVTIAKDATGVTDDDTKVPTSKAVKTYVDATATGISRYIGTITATSQLSTTAKKGDFYIVSTAWTGVHVGDEIIAEKNGPAQTIDGTNWTLLHNEADTNTTYTFAEGTTNGKFTVTPSDTGTAQSVTVHGLAASAYRDVDTTPTASSTKLVESGGVASALSGKQDTLTFDGTYNASTNKAATVSTVTNAINALDVTEVSVGSTKTINKISQTDGKISVSTTDIQSASTSQKGLVQLNDTLVSTSTTLAATANAVKAVNDKVETNKSNILSVADANGQKNLIFYDGFPKTEVGVTLSFDDNGGIELNGTCGGADDYAYIYGIYAYVDAGTVYSFIDSMYTGSEQYAFVASSEVFDNPPAFISSVNNRTAKISDKVTIVIRLTKGITYNKTKMYPMLCAKSLYDISPSYQPYAKSNSALTSLEAEDRAALAEEIDAGAKNKFPPNDFQGVGTVFTIVNNHDGTYKVNGSTGSISATTFAELSVPAGTYILSGCPSGGSSDTGYSLDLRTTGGSQISGSEDLGSGSDPITLAAGIYRMTIRFAANYTAPSAGLLFKPMLCTKAAFGVSSKFVPYRPNYDLVATRSGIISKLQEIGTDWTLIDLTFTGTAAYVYTLSAVVNASGNFPTGIAISTSNNASDFLSDRNLICKNDESPRTTRMMSCSALDIPYATTTYYVWAKSLTSSTNYVTLTYYREGR